MSAVGAVFCWFIAVVLVVGWSRLCFGAWAARTTTLTASKEDPDA